MPFLIHMTFDLLAITLAMLCGWLVYRWRFQNSLPQTTASIGQSGYYCFLSFVGAFHLFSDAGFCFGIDVKCLATDLYWELEEI